jgi:hypothetical protein
MPNVLRASRPIFPNRFHRKNNDSDVAAAREATRNHHGGWNRHLRGHSLATRALEPWQGREISDC